MRNPSMGVIQYLHPFPPSVRTSLDKVQNKTNKNKYILNKLCIPMLFHSQNKKLITTRTTVIFEQ